MILQRQVLQSCFDPGWCLRFSSSTEWTVYEMACFLCFPLLCTETRTHSAFLGRRCLGNAVALWRLVKEFRMFSTCCLRSSPGIWTLFPRAPCFWQPLDVRCDSPRLLLDEFRLFSTGSLRVRQSTVLLEEFHIFSTCWLSRFPAQFALENLDIISTCSHMAVGGVFRRL